MPEVLVETRYGRLRGASQSGCHVFRGVPFAAPPVGPRRFRAPAEPAPWAGIRDATSAAPMCPQPPPMPAESIPGDPTEMSEDCLYLNVWTEAVDSGRRPVMVWIHGGGFLTGSASLSLYRGEVLARRQVVVVSMNYRLGAFGWLAHPALAEEESPGAGMGNWGLLDQVAALKWVQEHIASFGGDPGNVTVFGESAGAISVAALLASPKATGLFHRAVIQSGTAVALGIGSAVRVADELATSLGLSRLTRAALVEAPVKALLSAQRSVASSYQVLGLPFQPVVDGGALDRHPAAGIAQGASSDVDLLVGTNRDEWKFFTFSTPSLHDIDEGRLHRLVRLHVLAGGLEDVLQPDELVKVYRSARLERGERAAPPELYSAMATDLIFRVPSMRLAEAHRSVRERTFAYLFDWEAAFGGGRLGACHALELPFVFGTLDLPFVAMFAGTGPEALRLSGQMQSAWAAFARSGDPSSSEIGSWPDYDGAGRATMRLGRHVELMQGPMEIERAWVDAALGPYGEIETLSLDRVRDPGIIEAVNR
jgi:para-nitrobenzyl esterase